MGPFSRRDFARAVGVSMGTAALRPALALASLPAGVAPGAIQLNSNENPTGPSPAAREAISGALAEASRYPDAAEARLVEAIARLHGLRPENVLLGCGSGEVLRMAAGAFLGPGRTLVACDPTFEAVLAYARVTSAEVRRIPQTSDFRHDLGAMAAACDARTGLVYVCNPNNPTGTLVGGQDLAAFLDRVPATATVLVDEAYHHYVDDAAYRSATGWLGERPKLVVARTFSKIYGMAGLRLGYAVAAPESVRRMREHATWDNANALALAAGLASLGDEVHVRRQQAANAATRTWLAAELARDGRRTIPSHANFVMIHLGRDVGPVIEAFRARDILVGRRFPSMPDWLRVSIGTRDEMAAFLSALREITRRAA